MIELFFLLPAKTFHTSIACEGIRIKQKDLFTGKNQKIKTKRGRVWKDGEVKRIPGIVPCVSFPEQQILIGFFTRPAHV
jgi:hypothetical protein